MFVTHDTHHVGGILTQQVDSIVHHISVYARALDHYELDYAYDDRERLAIVASTRTFAPYLEDNIVKIVLDPENPTYDALETSPRWNEFSENGLATCSTINANSSLPRFSAISVVH